MAETHVRPFRMSASGGLNRHGEGIDALPDCKTNAHNSPQKPGAGGASMPS